MEKVNLSPKQLRLWRRLVNKISAPEAPEKSKIEFEGYKYTWHPEYTLKMARDMSLRQGTLGGNFTASLITEVLHLREQVKELVEEKQYE